MENRIVELEIKVAYQERTLNELNEVILRQQQQIEQLEKRLAALQQRIATAEEPTMPTEEPPPPHY